jgi:3-oxoacyl-(acyl-carrier-protein) synthase
MAALPFDRRRSGMILGAGGIGMVLEREDVAVRRFAERAALRSSVGGISPNEQPFKCRLLHTLYSNSAYHGASLDRVHIASEMQRFLDAVKRIHGITRAEIAARGVYFSHETCTHATASASCAANEVHALHECFGELLPQLVILNTKGFTGHPMGVSFEDVVAVEVLCTGRIPPVANLQEPDSHLEELARGPLRLSRGGPHSAKYALRFAAGFGSQVAFALYAV